MVNKINILNMSSIHDTIILFSCIEGRHFLFMVRRQMESRYIFSHMVEARIFVCAKSRAGISFFSQKKLSPLPGSLMVARLYNDKNSAVKKIDNGY